MVTKRNSPSWEPGCGPVDVANSDDGKYFYVLNSDFDRSYNQGSILTIDESGEKLGAVKTRRMGRAMALSGTDLLIMYDRPEPEGKYAIELYDLKSNPKTRSWCVPGKVSKNRERLIVYRLMQPFAVAINILCDLRGRRDSLRHLCGRTKQIIVEVNPPLYAR